MKRLPLLAPLALSLLLVMAIAPGDAARGPTGHLPVP